MKYEFHVGDKVMITPEHWERLSKSSSASPEYINRGPNFIYTVKQVSTWDGDQTVTLAEGDGSWPGANHYLMPAFSAPEDSDIEIGGDIL